jgi:hypothetical protein
MAAPVKIAGHPMSVRLKASYPMWRTFVAPLRVYCLPMWEAWELEAALTLPVSLPELKSCAPSSVMDSGG